jgi:hypothetical protein
MSREKYRSEIATRGLKERKFIFYKIILAPIRLFPAKIRYLEKSEDLGNYVKNNGTMR